MKPILKNKKLLFTCLTTITIVVCCAFIVTSCLSGKREAFPPIAYYASAQAAEQQTAVVSHSPVVKIMTLNTAHGRKDGMNQIFQSSDRIKSNLDDIAAVLGREHPDLLGIQEADGPSAWSGNFSHVAYLAEKSGFSYSVRGSHVDGMNLSYGTALLSEFPLKESVSVTFEPSPPTFPKGYVAASFTMNDGTEIRVVSVHLDFSRESVRQSQVKEMVKAFTDTKGPLIIMGDFNCGWEEDSALQMLTEKLALSVYRPEAGDMITFPTLDKRLDWILISPELEFVSYRVIPDILSDHLGVVAEIRKKAESS